MVHLCFIYNEWALSRQPVLLGHEPAVRLFHVPDAHYVLHIWPCRVCLCDRDIPAQRGLRDLTPQHTAGHLLLSLTQCEGKYSRNGQSNERA